MSLIQIAQRRGKSKKKNIESRRRLKVRPTRPRDHARGENQDKNRWPNEVRFLQRGDPDVVRKTQLKQESCHELEVVRKAREVNVDIATGETIYDNASSSGPMHRERWRISGGG